MKLVLNLPTGIFASLTAVFVSGCIANTETADVGAERVDTVSEAIASAPKMGTTVSPAFSVYKPLDYICDTGDHVIGVYALADKPNPTMFFYEKYGPGTVTSFQGINYISGTNIYWDFQLDAWWDLRLMSGRYVDTWDGRTLYTTSAQWVEYPSERTSNEECLNPKGTIVQCITKSQSIYVTKEGGTLNYKTFIPPGMEPAISLTNGVYVPSPASNVRASVTFTNGSYKYVVRFSPHDATFFKGHVLTYKNGSQIGTENCDLMSLGQGSPGVNQSI